MTDDVVWEDPPVNVRKVRERKLRELGPRQKFVEKLKQRPGVWAFYREFDSKHTGYQSAHRFRRDFPGVEAKGTFCRVYVRWVGED